MTDTQLDVQPASAPARLPRRRPASPAPTATAESQPAAPAVEAAATEPDPEPTVTAQAAPVPDGAAEPAAPAEPPPAPARRPTRRPTPIAALDLALPGVSSAEIMAELDRRQRRAKALLAERERVIAEMDEVEAALEAIGEYRCARGGSTSEAA